MVKLNEKQIEDILIPQHSTDVYKKSFAVYDKIIQAGIFIIVMIPIISSYYQYNTIAIVSGLYIFLVIMSFVFVFLLTRYYCCCLQNDLKEESYKEENNKYCILILNKISENTRDVSIFFVIAMFSVKIYSVNTIIPIMLFIFASIPTLIEIKSKWFSVLIVAVIMALNVYVFCCFFVSIIL
ncbi:MAG: hypothetical protein ACRDA4_07290 [Filifactoraceae bacterium]